ncbi:MAG: lipid A deacylase LpxR family protein [Deltaproteobacteria bacterium]|nr:lipid A deacylase LpxR family protein [Deltaproteobacteria bacterium]
MFRIMYQLGKYGLLLTVVSLVLGGRPVYGQELPSPDPGKFDGVERATYRFEFDNDVFFGKDNKISSAWSLQKHSAAAGGWDTLEDVPGFIRRWGRIIPTLTEKELVCRAGIAIGQVIQTPDDLSRRDLIEDDVPYAGALTLQATWYAFNNDEFRGFEITAGVAGPPSLAEQTQRTVHRLINSEDPKGWDNQLSTEPVINFNYMRKKKISDWSIPVGLCFDAAINGNVGLGNLFTQASAALEIRFGRNMPRGFVYVPDPIGLSMHYMASLKPGDPQAVSFYATLVLRGSAFAHNIFLDGNTFRKSHSVKREPLVGMMIAGLHYERKNWGIHFNAIVSSHDVDTTKAPAAEGRERLGTIVVEWRF